jgi:hypothetical protein
MNDLIPRACCHISDKVGGNAKTGAPALLFLFFMDFLVEFDRDLYKFASPVYGQLSP